MSVRFAVVGTGYWAETVHLPGLLRQPGIELVGLWGRNAVRARALAVKFDVTPFTDFDAMLDQVDAVDFSIAPDAQAPMAQRAALAGKHLLLEKPVALSLLDARALEAAVRARSLASIVFLMRRFVPEIEDKVHQAAAQEWDSVDIKIHNAALSAGSPYEHSVWRHADDAALWDMGPHVFSILIPVLGTVRTIRATHSHGIVRVETTHARGPTATMSLSLRARPEDAVSHYQFASNTGTLSIIEPPFSRPEAFGRAASELAGNIVHGKSDHRCDIAFAVKIMAILAAGAQSLASGATVRLDTA